MKTDGTPLHGSYFDLASAKHPDLQASRPREERAERPPEKQRRVKLGVIPAVLVGALVGVVWLVIALRPEENVRLATAAQSSAATPAPRTPDAPPARAVEPEPATGPPVASEPVAERLATPEPAAVETAAAATRPSPPEPPQPQSTATGATVIDVAPAPAEPVAQPAALPEPPPVKAPVRRQTPPAPAAPEPAGEKVAVAQPAAPPAATYVSARKISATAPVYPEAARRDGVEGTVVVEAEVDATGAVTGTRVVRGRSAALDTAAAEALSKWRFEPARRDGVAVASSVRIGIRFDLQEAPAAAPAVPLEVGGDVEPPRRLTAPLPDYPNAAWAAGVTGDVLVRAVIDETGRVADVEVLRGQPYGMTEAAVEAIRQWTFAPARRDGRPVAVYHNLSVSFEG